MLPNQGIGMRMWNCSTLGTAGVGTLQECLGARGAAMLVRVSTRVGSSSICGEDSMNELLWLEACKRRLNGFSTRKCWHQVRLVKAKTQISSFFFKASS